MRGEGTYVYGNRNWPVVICMYYRLARRKERDMLEAHPLAYRAYYGSHVSAH